ncbi:hypothetical protein H4R33_003268 [Dimargaris cristalligena]|uniref:Gfd2/YDR514C-like C-terminal domain-containing protein n=1 Tax=Dimargaris cristalligena TaxID=215637 RepID=A0A4Q0A2T4_9FUNG|nr:hypothetical protein H4R33_003268 [Dimargaris cristalligena]RKP40404.1 hypothetical protein BJ085DRAFT_29729 [Dimargaris cristalligena]|eukprot:RKP40404.1 hypothetical protein BJ085DRAFT_29729 [Dimargaris cristalligena]
MPRAQPNALDQYKNNLASARQLAEHPQFSALCIDIEAYERNNGRLTEIGWCFYEAGGKEPQVTHYIVSENTHLCNGQYVPDRRYNFSFGESKTASLVEILQALQDTVQQLEPQTLVGHDLGSDLRYLSEGGVDLRDMPVLQFDTKTLYCAHTNNVRNGRKLGIVLDKMDIPSGILHNAGNDAYYTMKLFLRLVGIE